MFKDIVMVNYSHPPAERLQARKSCGPYHWAPAKPGVGRGFYQASKGLECDPRGSTFRLRLVEANDFLSRQHPLQRITGYYADNFCDCTLKPIVARLPNRRGFLAGWTMGRGMCASLDGYIWEDAADAAAAAHDMAEKDAEREREAAEDWEDAA